MPDSMSSLTREERLRRFRVWQESPFVHSLTCGNDSHHRPLASDDGATMYCRDCGYTQSFIPECIFSDSMQDLAKVDPLGTWGKKT